MGMRLVKGGAGRQTEKGKGQSASKQQLAERSRSAACEAFADQRHFIAPRIRSSTCKQTHSVFGLLFTRNTAPVHRVILLLRLRASTRREVGYLAAEKERAVRLQQRGD